ncbi:MAG: efflux RND transporter periplasmic adaptor subunit [Planctomycetes bacterium]|nr:efflux RND transporter periplasmic adaptor subunit [Planctomycetota bacterium]
MRSRKNHVAFLLASTAILAACASDESKTDNRINLYTVSRENLPINVKEGGELVAVNEIEVKSQIEGSATILSLIQEGTLVKKGDKLVELDVTDLVEKRANQEIAVEKARNALEQARTAQDILEKQLEATLNTAESQRQIAAMELQKLLGAKDGKGSEGKNADMVRRLEELVNPKPTKAAENATPAEPVEGQQLVAQVHPQNYAGLIDKVIELLRVEGEEGDPLQRDMGEMANKILQQADTIRLAMADLKVKEDTAAHSRRLAAKQFITRNELERDELAYQSQASKVTIAWNDLELLINYTLQRDKIEMRQNLENAELEVARVAATNDAERKNSQFDVDAKQKEFEIASDRLATLNRQIANSVIYSPGEGLVVYSKTSRGRGDSEPMEEGTSVRQYQTILILPDNSKLKCRIKVQEAMIDKVRKGMPAHISAEVRPNEMLTGRVTYVAPVADSASRWSGNDKKVYTTDVLLDGINRDESLKAGMKAAATITVDNIPDVLTVPLQSVRRDRAVNYVWKHTAEGPVAVAVKLGANNQEKVVVVEGVAEGDRIYRTPPGGTADPKFDQPAIPEPEEVKKPSGDAISKEAAERNRAGGRREGGRRNSRKKYTEMSPEELGEAKSRLMRMAGGMSNFLSGEQLDEAKQKVDAIIRAIDAQDLEQAQQLSDAMTKAMRGGRGGRGGERGGE